MQVLYLDYKTQGGQDKVQNYQTRNAEMILEDMQESFGL